MATAKPRLESLEDRTLPSVSSLPVVFTASPPAVPSVAAITSYVSSMMDQWNQTLAILQQDFSTALNAVGQEIAQEALFVQQQVDNLLGINPTPPNPTLNTAATQPNNDWGAGRGNSSGTGSMVSTHNVANPSLTNTKQQSGSGTGSGSSASSVHTNSASTGSIKAQMMSGSAQPLDSGSVGSGISGAGTGSVGTGTGSYGYASVSGKVWLDNNGDGTQEIDDNGYTELGYSGITVDLYAITGQGWTLEGSTTTGPDGSYSFQNVRVTGYPEPYVVHVDFASAPASLYATYHTSDNMINNYGNSSIFDLAIGGWRKIKAGLLSMVVTTTADDPNTPIQNQITLRDAIRTGNNGGGPLGLNVVTSYDFQKNQPLSGTIALQKLLDPINKSYAISGPGASTLAVSGANSFQDFAVNAGVTSIISGLTIENGSNADGAGVHNDGTLTLNSDVILDNTLGGSGGGIYNGQGSLKLSGDQILWNSGVDGGGLYNAGGTVTLTGSTLFNNNKSTNGRGGGIYNASGGTVNASGGTVISTNSTGLSGGGVLNLGTFFMTGGQISGNTASNLDQGGGVCNLGGSVRLLGVEVQSNSAGEGGGIYTSGKLTMGNNTTITGSNKASSAGAGIYVKGGTAMMVGGGVTNNTAGLSGGGIYVHSGQLTLQSGVRVSGNGAGTGDSEGYGGGIYISSGKVTVSGGTIGGSGGTKGWGNRAARSGGGIYNSGGILTLEESVNINGNWANNQGGGIYLAGPFSTTTFNVVTVSGNSTNGNQQTTGWGVYWQNGATVNPNPPGPPNNSLTDNDDPGKNPVKGP